MVQVEKEEELDEAERFDPELFVLAAPDGNGDRLEHVLDLLSDLPAGKLAIADLRDATQPGDRRRAGGRRRGARPRAPVMPDAGRRSSAAIAVAVFLVVRRCLGSRSLRAVLAPYFGNSLYVWGALIGVVLAGLSTGYWVGGAIADRYLDAPLARRDARSRVVARARDSVRRRMLEYLVERDPEARAEPAACNDLFGARASSSARSRRSPSA